MTLSILLVAWALALLLTLNAVRKKISSPKKSAFYLLVVNVMLGLFFAIMSGFNDQYPLEFEGFLLLMAIVIPSFSYIFYVAIRENRKKEKEEEK